MIILESDFKIEHNGTCFVLYFLKSKKELKEEKHIPYKIGGYYTTIISAIKAAHQWRLHKKYPFSEPSSYLKHNIILYNKITKELVEASTSLYIPTLEFKKQLLWK